MFLLLEGELQLLLNASDLSPPCCLELLPHEWLVSFYSRCVEALCMPQGVSGKDALYVIHTLDP